MTMAYSERKNTLTKKQLASMSKWPTQRPSAAEEAAKVSQQRRDLWTALNAFITERGGAIVSPMFVSPVRIETAPDSNCRPSSPRPGMTLPSARKPRASVRQSSSLSCGDKGRAETMLTLSARSTCTS